AAIPRLPLLRDRRRVRDRRSGHLRDRRHHPGLGNRASLEGEGKAPPETGRGLFRAPVRQSPVTACVLKSAPSAAASWLSAGGTAQQIAFLDASGPRPL